MNRTFQSNFATARVKPRSLVEVWPEALRSGDAGAEPLAPRRGRALALPGVFNTRFQLAPFARLIERRLPGFEVEIRPWGVPLRALHNLAAHARNIETAERIAGELTAWRSEHPREALYVMGFSGGGGMAVLVVSALPAEMLVDRLILVAPAISPTYAVTTHLVPRIREFIANFASTRDRQVGWGTRLFGTIDRERTKSAGAVGFHAAHPKLVQWHWSRAAVNDGHYGNHLSYLRSRWQSRALWPALDPAVDAHSLSVQWAVATPGARDGLLGESR